MRRRLLIGEGGDKYVFSAATTSKTVSYLASSFSISINSTLNGENTSYVVYSYDGIVTAVTTAATSVTIRYSENDTTSSRSGSVVLKQAGSDNMITISVTQNAPTYVFTAGQTLVSATCDPSSVTISINSTYGSNYVDFSVTSYNGNITSVTNDYNKIIVDYSSNPTSSTKNSYIYLKQAESNKTLTITIRQSTASYTFTASTSSISAPTCNGDGTSTVTITSTSCSSDVGFSVESYSGVVMSVTTAATSVTIKCRANYNPSASGIVGGVVLKQSGSNNKQYINAKTPYSSDYCDMSDCCQGIVINASNNSTGHTQTVSPAKEITTGATIVNKPSWINATISSDGRLTVTATSANNAATARTGTVNLSFYGEQTLDIPIFQLPSSYSSVDGHEYVTVGGLKWATKDVGGTPMHDDGDFYQWGAGSNTFVANVKNQNTGMTDISGTQYDTARQVMGGGWRMPTLAEAESLANITHYWGNYEDLIGCIFYDNDTKNCLFIASHGVYHLDGTFSKNYRAGVWTSTPSGTASQPYEAYNMTYHKYYVGSDCGDADTDDDLYRSYGFRVRGVHD